jgi:hypothetical protein
MQHNETSESAQICIINTLNLQFKSAYYDYLDDNIKHLIETIL